MRISSAVVAVWLMSIAAELPADGLRCGTSPENDRRVAALHARPREQARVAAAAVAAPVRRDGAFYLQANEEVAPGYRAFDLEGESLVFRPGETGGYTMSRESLQYAEPSSQGQIIARAIAADVGFTFSAFGRSVQRVYISPFLGITFDEAQDDDIAAGFSELEALVRPKPLIAPLMQTSPSLRVLPAVHVDRTPSALIVTWRSMSHPWFGYDVQAALHRDGTIVFSYKSLRNMRWGTPVIAPGTSLRDLPRRVLTTEESAAGTTAPVEAALQGMLDIRRVEVSRIAESAVFSIRMTLAAPVDASKLQATQSLRYLFIIGEDIATVSVSRDGTFVESFNTFYPIEDGVTGRVEGNTVEIFGLQRAPGTPRTELLNAVTFLGRASRGTDVVLSEVTLDAAPRSTLAVDLSAVANGSELALPILEPFVLPALDPVAVWEQVKSAYALSDDEIDGVAIYQIFFTDLILYATAYATVGNAQVDGIHPPETGRGSGLPRSPTLLHMNQLNFDENADDRLSSVVMLHEFGHRWLYTLQFADGASKNNVLSPQRYHPAAYVDTRSAFPLYGAEESSVMGGGHFTNLGGNRYRARSLRYGYSWTDLYLMGLAAPEEVPSWFYLSGTNPELPRAYFPDDGIEVTGTKHDVTLQQVIDAQGPRIPSSAASQRHFRVLFVLVTDPGKEPSAEEIAKIESLRAKMERDFSIVTGGRGQVTTGRSVPRRRRAVR